MIRPSEIAVNKLTSLKRTLILPDDGLMRSVYSNDRAVITVEGLKHKRVVVVIPRRFFSFYSKWPGSSLATVWEPNFDQLAAEGYEYLVAFQTAMM